MSETMKDVYEVEVKGEYLNGTVIHRDQQSIYDEITDMLDGIQTLAESDEPLTVAISGGNAGAVTLTIRRKHMSEESLDTLPEFDGW